MVKVGNMKRARRILLIATLLVVSVSSASASLWRHRAKKPEQATPANPAAAAMTLTAIEVGAPSQIVLRTSGAPAFTSLSPTPNQFVVDLSGTAKGTALAIPSPLPAGVTAVEGRFERGDVVVVTNASGRELARGLVAYNVEEARLLVGRRTVEIETILGYRGRDEMIHRDDLALTGSAGDDQ